jgi:hypothetical protein
VYAVTHAVTALPLKRQFPRIGLWPLLIAVQAIEILWVIFTYTGIEHIVIIDGRLHLGFLPYSHSLVSTIALAGLTCVTARVLTGDRRLGLALALGIVSHVVLDIIHHEPDVRLLPLSWGPRLGLGLTLHPLADAVVEIAYGVLCWQWFGGSWALLAGIVFLNVADVPFMFAGPDTVTQLGRHPAVVTTVVLVQILASWIAVWTLARRRSAQLAQATR